MLYANSTYALALKQVAWQSALLVVDCGDSLFELMVDDIKVLGHNLDIGDNGHEIGIAMPAWHDMEMSMIGEARARDLALVDAHIKSIGVHGQAERAQSQLSLGHQFGERRGIELRDTPHVLIGGDHHMSVIVGIEIEHNITQLTSINDMVLIIALSRGLCAKDALI